MADKNYIDYQLHFDKRIAKEYGLPEAVVINTFQKLIGFNKVQGKNYKLGRTWTYNSYEEWTNEKYFPCFSPEQMRRTLESLISQGVLRKSNFNKMKNDKTNWYSFIEEEKWVEKESPIPNYGADRPDGPPDIITNGNLDGTFFDENGLAKSAEQKEGASLPESANVNLNQNPLSDSVDQEERTGEIGNETAGIDRQDCRNRQNDLAKSAEHYHLNNISLTSKEAEEVKEACAASVVDTQNPKSYYDVLTEIVELEVIECVDRNYHKTLEFNFSDIDKLDKEVTRLFRMFVGGDSDKMNDININRIKRCLIDTRPELTRSICWIIMLRAFADYPTWGKEFKKVGSLLGRIEKQKNKFIEDLNKRIKAADLKEAAIARLEQSKSDKQERDVKIESEVERVGNYAEKYKNILRANEVTEIARLLAEGKPGSAEMVILDAIERKNAREVVE